MTVFQERYILIREKENRVYTDELVKALPDVPESHPNYWEWRVRRRSCRRLTRYLAAKGRPLRILEIGCGNGWLCHRLSQIPGAVVMGQDINIAELRQAERVFGGASNIRFTCDDLFTGSGMVREMDADIVIFAASSQYFSCLGKTLLWVLRQLGPDGEIHILDSPFYEPWELEEARRRTLDYFTGLGFPEMAAFYYHNPYSVLKPFAAKLLYHPQFFYSRILRRKDPFPWFCIRKRAGGSISFAADGR